MSMLFTHPQMARPSSFVYDPYNPNFFLKDELYNLGLAHYERMMYQTTVSDGKHAIDGSQNYLITWEPNVAKRIAETYDDREVKIIAILADPVVRAKRYFTYGQAYARTSSSQEQWAMKLLAYKSFSDYVMQTLSKRVACCLLCSAGTGEARL